MNFQSAAYFSLNYHYVATIPSDGKEYRHCFSDWNIGHFGYAVWMEQHIDGRARVIKTPEFLLTKTAARALAEEHCEEFRKSCPPCTYYQIIIAKPEFDVSGLKEAYGTLRRWVLAQGLDKADFAITPHRDYYRLSFRAMNQKVEDGILHLKLAGVVGSRRHSGLITDHMGRLEDVRGYRVQR